MRPAVSAVYYVRRNCARSLRRGAWPSRSRLLSKLGFYEWPGSRRWSAGDASGRAAGGVFRTQRLTAVSRSTRDSFSGLRTA
jgi:hypothetical protein